MRIREKKRFGHGLALVTVVLLTGCFRTIAPDQAVAQAVALPDGFELPAYAADEDIVRHTGYTASYNHTTLCPNWVAWELTAEEVNGTENGNFSFSRDPDVAWPKASREDYSHSGWDKGHMAPRADMRWSCKALEESYYFTNICPQDHETNSSAWRKIEELTRRMALRYGKVYVVCGPIGTESRFGRLGKGGVLIPEAFFKALAVNVGGKLQTVGFIVGNDGQGFSPKHYAVSVDAVEEALGRDLFPQADEETEATFNWKVWNF